jgi:hypothetical protein
LAETLAISVALDILIRLGGLCKLTVGEDVLFISFGLVAELAIFW